jgi:hypothetical protein
MWLTGRCGSRLGLWSACPGRERSGATTMTRYWSPSSAGMGMVGGRAVWPARVVTFDRSGSGAVIGVGATPRTRTDVETASSRVASWGSAMTRSVPRGGCGWKGCRDGCDAGARRWGRGLVWVQIGLAGGYFGMVRFAGGGLAGRGGCHTLVTSGAKHGGTEGDTLRRFLQVGGRGGTGWDG